LSGTPTSIRSALSRWFGGLCDQSQERRQRRRLQAVGGEAQRPEGDVGAAGAGRQVVARRDIGQRLAVGAVDFGRHLDGVAASRGAARDAERREGGRAPEVAEGGDLERGVGAVRRAGKRQVRRHARDGEAEVRQRDGGVLDRGPGVAAAVRQKLAVDLQLRQAQLEGDPRTVFAPPLQAGRLDAEPGGETDGEGGRVGPIGCDRLGAVRIGKGEPGLAAAQGDLDRRVGGQARQGPQPGERRAAGARQREIDGPGLARHLERQGERHAFRGDAAEARAGQAAADLAGRLEGLGRTSELAGDPQVFDALAADRERLGGDLDLAEIGARQPRRGRQPRLRLADQPRGEGPQGEDRRAVEAGGRRVRAPGEDGRRLGRRRQAERDAAPGQADQLVGQVGGQAVRRQILRRQPAHGQPVLPPGGEAEAAVRPGGVEVERRLGLGRGARQREPRDLGRRGAR
jgi:hypothetical protein